VILSDIFTGYHKLAILLNMHGWKRTQTSQNQKRCRLLLLINVAYQIAFFDA